ncbi:glycoside hydrolase family 38 C-terminal domain-containing protein [Sulfobacillus harzensis]|uniref:Glycoside hydrolase family 38 central domain-containing protein n=1 Tax=Sulfobacillus harzensis TaxID=2729629 RepID=A0A7Y0L4L9_9FIRM|nr:glycoside hydrolase family 38 C-terminal domain-containing protein [Sulfobacillus harzensis]NMP23125.1 hypothetical protein [Sulfobacillus harzensis]
MFKSYQFWLTLLWTWSVVQREPITDWMVQYAGQEPRVHDPDFHAWTEPEISFRTLFADAVVPWEDAVFEAEVRGETLLRVDNQPACGLNPFHTRFPLHHAAGDRVLLTLEQVTTGLMGVASANPGLDRCHWIRLDPMTESCYWDLAVLLEWGDDPDTPPDLKRQLARWLDQALAPLIARAPDEDALRAHVFRTGRSAEEEGLARALHHGPVSGLQPVPPRERRALVATLHQRLRDVYQSLHHAAPKGAGKLVMMGHAHIDLAWLWPMAETARKTIRTAAGQAALLEAFPAWRFGMSSPEMWRIIQTEPDLARRWLALADSHRVEPLGAFWVEADSQLLGGTSLLRHLAYGLEYFEKTLGRRPRTAFLPDTFGFSGALPTFLNAAGIDLFLTTKINWNDSTRFPYKHFRWVGPDGSAIAAMIFGNSPDGYNGTASIRDLKAAWDSFAQGGGEGAVLYAFGHGDGGGGPDESMLQRLTRYRQLPLLPDLVDASPESLILPPDAEKHLPRWHGDLYLEFHRGVFTTQTRVKSETRQVERELASAEAWAIAAGGRPDLKEAWTTYLRNHFHDILPGSSIGAVYEDFRLDMEIVRHQVHAVEEDALNRLFPGTGTGTALVIGHRGRVSRPEIPLMVERRGAFQVFWGGAWHQSRPVGPHQYAVDVPALPPASMAAFPLQDMADEVLPSESRPSDRVRWMSRTLEVVIGPDGLHSLKHEGRELLDGVAGVELFFQHPREFDAWELEPSNRRGPVSLQHDIPVIEWQGPHTTIVQLHHHRGETTIKERITLNGELQQIDLAISLHIAERRLVTQYRIPTTLSSDHVSRETLFGADTLPARPSGPADEARFEWAAHRFIDLAEPHQGLALMNDGRFGHHVDNGTMSITLSTAPLYPDPGADGDPVPVRLALVPHRAHWTDAHIMERAQDFSEPPMISERSVALKDYAVAAPLLGLPPNVALLNAKPAEDGSGDVIYHLGEMWGDACHVKVTWPYPVSAAFQADLVSEEPLLPLEVHEGYDSTLNIRAHQLFIIRMRPLPN